MDGDLLNDVVLLASEIATNAVQHSGRPDADPLIVQAHELEDVLRVEVTDRGSGVHNLEARSVEPPSGLGYVHLLSDRWSSTVRASFQVWFEIDVETRPVFYPAPS